MDPVKTIFSDECFQQLDQMSEKLAELEKLTGNEKALRLRALELAGSYFRDSFGGIKSPGDLIEHANWFYKYVVDGWIPKRPQQPDIAVKSVN